MYNHDIGKYFEDVTKTANEFVTSSFDLIQKSTDLNNKLLTGGIEVDEYLKQARKIVMQSFLELWKIHR